jgi:hypothetical protein
MPAFLDWGYWDVWPSWAVYSSRGGGATLFVRSDDVKRLPEVVRPFVRPPAPLSDWHPVDVDRWSLEALKCPVYPQNRFRMAVAAALGPEARVEVRSPPHRQSGASVRRELLWRDGRWWNGPEFTESVDVESRYWLNLKPRTALGRRESSGGAGGSGDSISVGPRGNVVRRRRGTTLTSQASPEES